MSANPLSFPRALATVLREIDHDADEIAGADLRWKNASTETAQDLEGDLMSMLDDRREHRRKEVDAILLAQFGVSFDDIARRM